MTTSQRRLRHARTLLALFVLSVLLSACDFRGALEFLHNPGALERAAAELGTPAADAEMVAERVSELRKQRSERPSPSDSTSESDDSDDPEEGPSSEDEQDETDASEPDEGESEPSEEGESEPSEEPAEDADDQSEAQRSEPQRTEERSEPAPPSSESQALSAIEQEVFDLLNSTRDDAGLAPLELDEGIAASSRSFSCEMASGEAPFAHDTDKIRAAGANGENIAFGTFSEAEAAQRAHDMWMESQGHRDNRMNPDFRTYGIGVCSEGNRIYFTERFAF